MFPIISISGNVIAFGGRSIGQGIPKYLNSSDTAVFKKRDNLFSLNIAKKSHNDFLILVEGYMDAISLFQAGFENVAASLGTAITLEQVKLISRFFNEAVISYDSDEAGKKAALRAIDLFKENGISVRVVNIENAKDPDEFLSSNGEKAAEKFGNLIKNSKFDIEYMLFNLKNKFDFKKTNEKINYLHESSKILAKLKNPIERDVYIKTLCEETGVDKVAIMTQIEKFKISNEKKNKFKKINFPQNIADVSQKAEENLLSYIINNPSASSEIFLQIDEKMFVYEFNKKILCIIQNLINSEKKLTTDNLFETLSFEEISKLTKIICSYDKNFNTEKAVLDYISVIKNKYAEKIFENLEEIDDTVINNFIKQKFI
jgi:DNA primase